MGFWDQSDFGLAKVRVMNYMEVVLKITDNGAAVKKDILYT